LREQGAGIKEERGWEMYGRQRKNFQKRDYQSGRE